MKKFFAAAAVGAALLACPACNHNTDQGGGGVLPTASEPVPSAPIAAPAPSPQPVLPPTEGRDWAATFYQNAGFDVQNLTGIGQAYRAYTTSFDNQSVETDHRSSGTVPPGKDFVGSFHTTCVQLDISSGDSPAGVPFTFAYFDKQGHEFDPGAHPEKTIECRQTPCQEPREHSVVYGEFSWNTPILEGKCEVETFPLGVDSVSPELNCHQTGSQDTLTKNICSSDTKGTRALCRNVACPTPPPVDVCPNIEGIQLTVPQGYYKNSDGQCVQDPTCDAGHKLVDHQCVPKTCQADQYQCPVNCVVSGWSSKVYGTPTACLENHYTKPWTETRTVTTPPLYGGTSCPGLIQTGTDIFECQSYCEYEVSGQDKNTRCIGFGGLWENWDQLIHHNHCRIPFPGVSDDKFQIDPAKSDPLCLDKHALTLN